MLAKTGTKALGLFKGIKVPAKFAKFGLLCKKHSPEIMVVAGTVLVIGGTIMACKKTIKAHDILEQANREIKEIDQAKTMAADPSSEQSYTDKDARNDRMIIYGQTAGRLFMNYAPAILAIGAGLGLMLGAHKILLTRNAALTAAYSKLLAGYNAYRTKVANTIGTDEEKLLSAGANKMDISVEDEDGNSKNIKNAMVVEDDGTTHSIYARIFDECNPNWSRNPVSNLTFLRAQQNFANDALRAKGYLFLNDVYEMLGFPKTSEGQIVGWYYDPRNEVEGHIGDDYVNFGIYDQLYKSAAKREFINAAEPCVWLDFNVDGVMYNLI